MPWIHAQVLAIVAVAGSSGLAFAEEVDLAKVDRSIGKEPVWVSAEPQYCLFVISAERRVWFVVDGDDLYMDINGNGDLTDPGEKLPRMDRSDEQRREVRDSGRWRIPDIAGADGAPLITNIKITPDTNSRAAANGSKFVYFEIPVYGRVHTRPTFAGTPADAPILHPTGPHRLSLSVRRSYLPANRDVSNTFHVDGHKCVEGLGRGTSFALATVNLDCRIEFPLTDGGTRVKEFRLKNYITGPYQTAPVNIPEGANDNGTVKITLSRRSEATGPAVAPAVLETPVTKLRAVRRAKARDEAKLQRDISTERETLAKESDDEADQQPATAQAEKAAAQQILVTNHLLMGKIAQSEGDTSEALTWYHQAYRDAAPDDPRRTSARNLIGAWGGSLKKTLVHDRIVHAVVISPDGRKLLAGYYDSRSQIWDLATGMPQGPPLPFRADTNSTRFSADGGFVLLGDKVFDVATGQLRYPALEHEMCTESELSDESPDSCLKPVLSPDGRSIVTRSPFTGIRIWDAETGKPRGESLPLGKIVGSMFFSPDSKRVVAWGRDIAKIWDVEKAQPVGEPFIKVTNLVFHPAGHIVAVGRNRVKIVLHDLDSGKQIAELDHDKPLHSVEFDGGGKNLLCHDGENAYLWLDVLSEERTRRVLPHGSGLFTASFSSADGSVLTASSRKLRAWKVGASASSWERNVPREGGRGDNIESAIVSPDGKSLLTLTQNNTAEVISVATGRMLVRELKVLPRAATFSADGSSVIFGSSEGWVRVHSVSASDERRLPKPLPREICSGSVIALSPDGKLIFVVGPTEKSYIYRTDTWEPVGKPLEGLYHDYKDAVGGAAFSPDNRTLVTSMSLRNPKMIFRSRAQVEFWDVATTSRIGEPTSLPRFAGTVTFDPSGRYARVGDSVIDVETRSIRTFEADRIPEGHQPVIQLLHHGDTSIPLLWDDEKDGPTTVNVPGEDVKMASLSPDGRRLLIVRKDASTPWGIARLFDAATGTPLGPAFQIVGFPGARTDDGRYALFGANTTLRLWDTLLGRPCGEPLMNEQSNVRPTFSPDGTVVATNWGSSAHLWDSATGLALGPPMRMPSTLGAKPIFSPDGRRLYISSSGLEVWRVPPPAADEPERLRLSIEVRTGLEVDENSTIQKLSQAGWLERKRRLKDLGGPCDVAE